jgi:CHAT domain-containing protein
MMLVVVALFVAGPLFARQEGDVAARAASERDAAYKSFDRGEFEDALAHFDAAREQFEKLSDELALAKIAHNRAAALVKLHREEEALAGFTDACERATKLKNSVLVKSSTKNRAIALRNMERLQEAHEAYTQAAALYVDKGDELVLAEVCADDAIVLGQLDQVEESFAQFERALKLCERDARLTATILARRGHANFDRRRFVDALRDCTRAEALHAKLDDPVGLSQIECTFARVYVALGRSEEALERATAAESIMRKAGMTEELDTCINLRASALNRLGRREEAIAELDRALVIARAEHDVTAEAYHLRDRAALLAAMRRPADALAAYTELEPMIQKKGLRSGLTAMGWNRAVCYVQMGRTQDALLELESLEKLSASIGDAYSLANISIARGIAFIDASRPADALVQFGRASRRIEELLLGGVAELGDTSSRSLREEFGDAFVGMLQCLGSLAKRDAAQIADAYRVLQTFQGLGLAQRIAEVGAESERSGRETLEFVARAERKLDAARRRSLELLERDAAPEKSTEELESERTAARSALESASRECAAAVERARSTSPRTVALRYPSAASEADVRKLLPLDTALVEYALGGDVALAFVLTNSAVQVVDLGKRADISAAVDEVRRALDPATGAKKLVALELASALRNLGRRALSPVLAALPGETPIDTLWIAPSGDLCRVPLEMALVDDVKPGTDRRDWPFLVARRNVSYVHSGTALIGARARAAAVESEAGMYIAFADPRATSAEKKRPAPADFVATLRSAARLQPLPFAANEIVQAARNFTDDSAEIEALDAARERLALDGDAQVESVKGRTFDLLLGAKATEANVRAEVDLAAGRVLHLACHAVSDLDSPDLSRLILSSGGSRNAEDDGVLFVGELAALDLSHYELLTLSACSTNAGKLDEYEGATGLARAGLFAGARAVLSTMWEVDDAAASELVAGFYKSWIQGRETRVRALAESKRRAIRADVPISTWSAYILWDVATQR